MKSFRLIILSLLVALCLSMSMYSCMWHNEDYSYSKKQEQLKVVDAEAYFEGFIDVFNVAPFTAATTRSVDYSQVVTPLWERSKQFTLDGKPSIEVPLNTPNFKISERVIEEPDEEMIEEMIEEMVRIPQANAKLRLLIQQTEERDLEFTVVRYVADSVFFTKKGNKLLKIWLSDLSNFSGQVRYYNLDGTLKGGLIYKYGQQTGIIKSSDEFTGVPGCESVQTRGWETRCEWLSYGHEVCWPDNWWEEGVLIVGTPSCEFITGSEYRCTNTWVPDPEDWGTGGKPGGNTGGNTGGGTGGTGGTGSFPSNTGKASDPTTYNMKYADKQAYNKISGSFSTLSNNKSGKALLELVSNVLKEKKVEITIKYDPDHKYPASYNDATKTITFKDVTFTKVLFEEFFHVFQYHNSHQTCLGNIELEAKLVNTYLQLYKESTSIRDNIHIDFLYPPHRTDAFRELYLNCSDISCFNNAVNAMRALGYTGYQFDCDFNSFHIRNFNKFIDSLKL